MPGKKRTSVSSKDIKAVARPAAQSKKVVVRIDVDDNIQKKLDKLKSTVTHLHITGCGDEEERFTLEKRLPRGLKLLEIEDAHIHKLVLNDDLTPSLQKLSLQQAAPEIEIDVKCSGLKSIILHHIEPACDGGIQRMLLAATKLETFESFKLWVPGGLVFTSSQLEYVRLHRSDCLGALVVYSPVLKMLDLRACYDLRRVDILSETKGFPAINPKTASEFDVNIMNCSFPEILIPSLDGNPRVRNIRGAEAADMDDEFGDDEFYEMMLSFV